MPRFLSLAWVLVLFLAVPLGLRSQGSKVFPYDFKVEVLANGLKVVCVPLSNPNIIAYYTIVRSGSRNEVEPGKSGFAHFFEHMMFKGTKAVPRPAYDDYLTRLGAGTNGFTSDDYTVYFVVFAGRDNLEEVVKTEADRFINLAYDEEMIKTEASVIEGEYYASVSSPERRLAELLRDTAYETHPYKHTTMGYLKDIQDMPHQYPYSLLYKKRFYAPDHSILLVVGDFDQARLMELVKKYYGPWQPSHYRLVTPVEPPQKKAKRARLTWPSKTLARLSIGFHGPAFSDEKIDKAALDLLAEAAFSKSSAIYQKLVIEEQKCQDLFASFPDRRDPSLLTIGAVIKKDEDLAAVEKAVWQELERLKAELVSAQLLSDIKSNLKYSLANGLDTSDGVAGTLFFYISLTSDPGSLNKLFDLYDKVTPTDIQDMAKEYFTSPNSTTVILTGGQAQ
jgi:zinc protease